MHTKAEPIRVTETLPARVAADVLTQHRGLVRELWVEVAEGGVVLHGTAYSYYGKQVAQHEVLRRTGLVLLANRVRVIGPAGTARG